MKCKDIAKYISQELVNKGFIVHRYDSYSTCSIYLKLDYGACNSIRISDHNGYQHLSYKYNIISGYNNFSGKNWHKDKKGFWRYTCSTNIKELNKLLDIIYADRQYKRSFNNYEKLIEQYKSKIDYNLSFWRECEEIKL